MLPPEDLAELQDVSTFLAGLEAPASLLGPGGQQVPLPSEAFEVLRDVVEAMCRGQAINVQPVDQILTTQEAANFLGISRPTLVKLLEEGKIAYELPSGSRHRRVRLVDVIEYQDQQRRVRRQALDELTADASSAGLYVNRQRQGVTP